MAEQGVVAAELEQGGPVPTDKVNPEANTKPDAAGDPQGNANEGEHETEEQRRKSGYQRQKEARLRAEAEAKYYRELLAQRQQPTEPAKPKGDEDPEPEEKDFESLGEYLKAARAWDRRQAKRDALAEIDARSQKAEQQKQEQARQQTWAEQAKAAAAKYSDFDDVITDPSTPISQQMAQVIQRDSKGAELAYYIGTHPDEGRAIYNLKDPVEVALAMGELKAKLAQEKSEPAKEEEKPEPPVSKAPPPPSPVRKPTAANVPDIHDPKLPFKDFVKLRNAKKDK